MHILPQRVESACALTPVDSAANLVDDETPHDQRPELLVSKLKCVKSSAKPLMVSVVATMPDTELSEPSVISPEPEYL